MPLQRNERCRKRVVQGEMAPDIAEQHRLIAMLVAVTSMRSWSERVAWKRKLR